MTPDIFQNDDMSFSEFGLGIELLKAVEANGYATPTPIQSRVIPAILDGRNILARAQTGTGNAERWGFVVYFKPGRLPVNIKKTGYADILFVKK